MARPLSAGAFVTVNWSPDPIVYEEGILEVAEALAFTRVPITAAASEVQMDIKERFEQKNAPDGSPWDEWSEDYEPYAEAWPNIDMLRQSDVMYNFVTSDKAMIITNEALFFDAADLPPTSTPTGKPKRGSEARIRYHQDGTEKMPARPFLGLSDDTVAFIDATFIEWFNRSVSLFTRKGGGIGQRHALRSAASKGKFVSRSTPLPMRVR